MASGAAPPTPTRTRRRTADRAPAPHGSARRRAAPTRRFRTPVRGYRFAARPPGAGHPRRGQGVLLHHERGHPKDEWAVAIWTRSADGIPWRIGYLERSVAARLGPHIRAGLRLTGTVGGWMAEPAGRWRRPVIQVDLGPLDERRPAHATA